MLPDNGLTFPSSSLTLTNFMSIDFPQIKVYPFCRPSLYIPIPSVYGSDLIICFNGIEMVFDCPANTKVFEVIQIPLVNFR